MRIVYRLCEFSRGTDLNNPMLTSEVYPYVLDGMPMLLASVLLNICHPGMVLKGPESEFPRLSRKEKKALKQEKKAEKQRNKWEKNEGKKARKEGRLPRGYPGAIEMKDSDAEGSVAPPGYNVV
jgi:RTA1 like protein